MLSDSRLYKLHRKPCEKIQVLSDRDGLYVRISVKGAVTFFMRYRFDGKAQQMMLGSYPAMSLKQARARNLHFRGLMQAGQDPRISQRLERESAYGCPTFEALAHIWYEKYARKQLKNHKANLASLELYIFPRFGALPADKITTHHWLDALESVTARSPSQAGSC